MTESAIAERRRVLRMTPPPPVTPLSETLGADAALERAESLLELLQRLLREEGETP